MITEIKEGMVSMFHQIEKINKEVNIIRKNQTNSRVENTTKMKNSL